MANISFLIEILDEFFNSENPVKEKFNKDNNTGTNFADTFKNINKLNETGIKNILPSNNKSIFKNNETNNLYENKTPYVSVSGNKEQNKFNKNVFNNKSTDLKEINKEEQESSAVYNIEKKWNHAYNFRLQNKKLRTQEFKEKTNISTNKNDFKNNFYIQEKSDINEIGILFAEILSNASNNRSNASGY